MCTSDCRDGVSVSVLGRLGKWLATSLAFGPLVRRDAGIANRLAQVVAADAAMESLAANAARFRRTPGAFGAGRYTFNAAGSKLARACRRAYKAPRKLKWPDGGSFTESGFARLRVRGF